jgi:hypothetical protein
MNWMPPGEFAIFVLALPAFASPLIVMPLPSSSYPLPDVVRSLVTLCSYPRLWASAATLIALVWVVFSRASPTRKKVGTAIALLAWIPALNTARTISGWERF